MVYKDEDGQWHKIIKSEHVDEAMVAQKLAVWQEQLERVRNGELERELQGYVDMATVDLETLCRG